ncbi:hypothetical protein D9M69_541550 [compost metagenome]
MAALGQQALGLVDVARGIAAGQRPQHRQRVAHGAAQQRRQRHAQALALRVEQRRFQRRLGEAVAARHLVQPRHGGVHVGGILPNQRRRQVSVEGQLDALGAFIAIGQAADGGGLADAFHAIGAAQADDREGLPLHGRHGELVRADGRQVDQDGLDRLDGRGAGLCRHFHTFLMQLSVASEYGGLFFSCPRPLASDLIPQKYELPPAPYSFCGGR